MAFNLGGASNNTGKLQIKDFISTPAEKNIEVDIPINQLVPWENQPFKMYNEFQLNELAESIRENGLLSRIIVSPIDGVKYRILAGHNRVEACRKIGFTSVPSVVKDVDENRAKLIMADTNLCQRSELLPSERAYAYKAQQEALIALGSKRATMAIAEKYGEGKRTIQRYLSCTRLIPELMTRLDDGNISLLVGEILSKLPESSQYAVEGYLTYLDITSRRITFEQAEIIADMQFVSESELISRFEGLPTHSSDEESDNNQECESSSDNTEKKKSKSSACGKKITIKRAEITQVIGEKLTNDEIAEYFFYCIQQRDLLEKWYSIYNSEEKRS